MQIYLYFANYLVLKIFIVIVRYIEIVYKGSVQMQRYLFPRFFPRTSRYFFINILYSFVYFASNQNVDII